MSNKLQAIQPIPDKKFTEYFNKTKFKKPENKISGFMILNSRIENL